MAFVADNSVIVAWFVKSQATPYTWSILERAAAGEAIHVPLLWCQEFVNAMVVLERRRRLKAGDAAQAFTDLGDMNLVCDRELVGLDTLADLARRVISHASAAAFAFPCRCPNQDPTAPARASPS